MRSLLLQDGSEICTQIEPSARADIFVHPITPGDGATFCARGVVALWSEASRSSELATPADLPLFLVVVIELGPEGDIDALISLPNCDQQRSRATTAVGRLAGPGHCPRR